MQLQKHDVIFLEELGLELKEPVLIHHMSMFSFDRSILMKGMWNYTMKDTNFC